VKHWSKTRLLSFGVHTLFVSVPFFAASASALILWHDLFGSWWYAVPMVAVVDVLALTGMVLYIARIPSPFQPLRHALPFVSVVPLGRELYLLLQHNGAVLAGSITLLVIALFTWIAWQCFTTIEALFIPPADAARERARERLGSIAVELARLSESNDVVREFVAAYQTPRVRSGVAAQAQSESAPVVTASVPPALSSESKTARIKALAKRKKVAVSTAWRKVRAGEWEI
jgi:hypothetical protein